MKVIARPLVVAIDLDGTLAKKQTPFNIKTIGEPRHGAKDQLTRLKSMGLTIVIYTVRSDTIMVKRWLRENHIPFDHINYSPTQPRLSSDKLMADVYIDDRAISAKGVPLERAVGQALRMIQESIKERS
jgi:uncharacterized HAD superfamily protein